MILFTYADSTQGFFALWQNQHPGSYGASQVCTDLQSCGKGLRHRTPVRQSIDAALKDYARCSSHSRLQ